MMYGRGKSDSAIVAAKLVNKAGRLAAESVERRAGAKGKAAQRNTCRAQELSPNFGDGRDQAAAA